MIQKMTQRGSFGAAVFLLFFLGLAPLASSASRPLDVVRSGSDRALDLLKKNCRPGEPLPVQEHRDEILDIVHTYFDFEEMGKRALGRHWKGQSPANQKEFISLFERLIFNTYLDRVDTYTCSNENVAYDGEQVEGAYALVKTRVSGVSNYKEIEFPIEYRLRLKDGDWKVYDVVIEGVSLVNNYRSQFDSMLSKGSFDDLISQLRGKVDSQQSARAR
jgi:phospholipid transport system substrate-binding protein